MTFSPNSIAPASARITRMTDFPFCLAMLTPTVRAAHEPSDRTPHPASSTSVCHGSKGVPYAAASSATRCASFLGAGGDVRNLGATALGELVDN